MEFKVGDRVRIREDLNCDDPIYGYILHEDMLKYKGMEANIVKINDYYELDIDNREWAWTTEMFENYEQRKIRELEQRIEKLEEIVNKQNNCQNEQNNSQICKISAKNEEIISKSQLLTEDERVILRNLDKRFEWIARDENGDLYVYEEKPEREKDDIGCCFWLHSNGYAYSLYAFEHMFKFVTFHDGAYNIEELLKGECGNE